MNANDTGQKISALRKEKQMTQKELAEQLHVSGAAVSKWERGLNFPDLAILEPLAGILGVSAAELLGLENEPAEKIISSMTELSGKERRQRKKERKRQVFFLAAAVCVFFAVILLILLVGRDTPENNRLLGGLWHENMTFLPLVSGLAAWGFGIAAVFSDKEKAGDREKKSMCSLAFCSVGLYFPVMAADAQFRFGDLGTLEDTIWGWNFASAALLAGTLLLNGCAWKLHGKRKKSKKPDLSA